MAKIKLGAFGDTHIGYRGNSSLYGEFGDLKTDQTTEEGINIRTKDVNDSFAQAISIFIEEGVDLVCHTGDGMNHWGYKHPFYFNFYMDQIHRLTEKGIEYFEIAGNHNFAKKSGVGCELFKLNLLERAKAVYRGFYEAYDVPGTNITLHGLPSSFNKEFFQNELDKVEKVEGRFNVLVAHCGITTIDHYAKSESSIVVHLDDLKSKNMEMVLLGDYHKFVDFGDHTYYTGATDHFSFAEAQENPRVLIFEIDDETNEIEVRSVFLDVRPMIDLPAIDGRDKAIEEIQKEMIALLEKPSIEDAIVRMRISNLPSTLRHKHLLLNSRILELQEKPLIFKLDFKNKMELSSAIKTNDDFDFENIFTSFDSFIERLPEHPEFPKETLLTYGLKYLKTTITEEG